MNYWPRKRSIQTLAGFTVVCPLTFTILEIILPTLLIICSAPACISYGLEGVVDLGREVWVDGLVLHNGDHNHDGRANLTQPGLVSVQLTSLRKNIEVTRSRCLEYTSGFMYLQLGKPTKRHSQLHLVP